MSLIVHHLNHSRSQRLLWMLEELELPYDIRFYARNKATMLAPPELKAVHPLGKSPVPIPETIAPPGLFLTCVRDPDGNIVELIGPRSKR